MRKLILAASSGLYAFVSTTQISTSTFIEPAVPTGTPIPGNYSGVYRPQVHFSPPQFFMNDPNGLFLDANGTYHLYYQYDPTGLVAGNQHWGHATSADLYHWTNQPIAIFPPDSSSNVFTGSAVIDSNNTSGFFPNQNNGVVAIYTLNTPTKQVQAISYSRDGGFTFTPFEGNPVIDSNSTQFRDPKVIWHAETEKWVMVVAYSQDFVIGVYTSPNLKDWTHASNLSHVGLLGLQYECPNLVKVPVRNLNSDDSNTSNEDMMYVLTISINPGAPLGGSITQYFPGSFNGTHFTPVDNATRLTDFAKDNYAGQFFFGIPDGTDPLSIAWANNWQYAEVVPTAQEGWRSAMSLPRRNHLVNDTRIGWDLVSLPVDLSPVLGQNLATKNSSENGTLVVDFSGVQSNAVYFEANVSSASGASDNASLNFTFLSPISNESLSGGFFFSGDFLLDRGNIKGFNNSFFTDKFSTSIVPNADGTFRFSGVFDRSMLEVFVDEVASATTIFFPVQPLTTLTISAVGLPEEAQISMSVWKLESVWKGVENDQGIVVGNITDGAGNKTNANGTTTGSLSRGVPMPIQTSTSKESSVSRATKSNVHSSNLALFVSELFIFVFLL